MADVPRAPGHLTVELVGGDELGRHVVPALSWWLPDGAATQTAYRIVTDDGYDSGVVASDRQSYVEVPVFDRSRRLSSARVQVQTDLGESAWSEPVALESGLLDPDDWSADWIGVFEAERPEKGLRPAYWLRSEFDAAELGEARLYVTALGLYEVFLNGQRVGDVELAPGYTQYAQRVPYQTFDVASLLRPGRNVLAALLADGWYRGQVGAPRPADQFGTDVALRLQLELHTGGAWTTVARTDSTWRTSPSYVTAADLIGGQHEDRRLVDGSVHEVGFGDAGWAPVTRPEHAVAIVPPMSPPVRRVEEITAVSVTRLDTDGAFIADLGQNINGWTRLADLGPVGSHLTLRHGEHLDTDGDLTTEHLTINLPFLPAPLPVGQVDEVVSAGEPGDVFEPRFTTHGFQYVRIEGHPGPLAPEDVTGVVVHSDLRRTGWFECSDERINRLHEAVVWSLRGNMCAIPTDCPQRERSGWTGDWQIFAPTAAYLFDVNGFTRSWLRDIALDRRADGCVGNISPATPTEGFDGGLMARLNGSAGWGDVVASAPWDLYQAYGDATLLRESWAAMTGWVDYAARTAAENRHPTRVAARPEPSAHEEFLWDTGFHWGEWLEPGLDLSDFGAFAGADKSDVATAYLHRSALTVAEVGEVLGEDEATVARYRAHRSRARRTRGRPSSSAPTGRSRCRPRRRTCARWPSGWCPTTSRAGDRGPARRAGRRGRRPSVHGLPVHGAAAPDAG